MNPYNQQYPYSFPQQTPGPPQPQWQPPPRRGWGDPRPQDQQQQQPSATPSPISPFNSSALGYQAPPPPPLGGPFTPQQGQQNRPDTSSWGVKYNQTLPVFQQQEERPPLPPRPMSVASHSSPKPEQVTPSSQWPHGYGATPSQPQPQNQWTDTYYAQGQHQAQSHDVPPPPPPRPPEYQSQLQTQYQQSHVPHDHYSHHPPSHNYDAQSQSSRPVPQPPLSHHYNSSTASMPHQGPMDNAPVSPIDPDTASQFYSSALGTGGPSDWEHFGGPTTGMIPDAVFPPPRMEATAMPGFNVAVPNMPVKGHERLSSVPTATFESPAPMHATPAPPPSNGGPPMMQHSDSDNTSVVTDGVERTGTIDSVIEAWTTPLKVAPKAEAHPEPRPTSQGSAKAAVQTPVQERIVEVEKIVEKIVDPYDDLEPEVKASLKRYVATLRKESAAETDEEKFSIFENFVVRELRLRSMMYGIEVRLKMGKEEAKPETGAKTNIPPVAVTGAQSSQPAGEREPEPTTTLQPAPPPSAAQTQQQTDQTKKVAGPEVSKVKAPDTPMQVVQAREAPRPMTPASIQIQTKEASPQSRDDFVMVNAGDDEPEYSPGGRPRVKKPAQIVTGRASPASPPQAQRSQMSPSANAPMVLEDYLMPGPPSPSANAPMTVEPTSATDLPQVVTPSSSAFNRAGSGQSGTSRPTSNPAIKFEPARPAYTPFKYNPNVETPKLPADKSYSTLRKEGVGSGRLLVHELSFPAGLDVSAERSSTPSRRAQDEAFIGLIRSQSKAVRKKTPEPMSGGLIAQLRPGTPARTVTPSQQAPPAPKVNDVKAATAALRQLLPETVPDSYGLSQHTKANSVKAAIDSMPDSFGFIHESVVAWDRKNREVHKKLDEERSVRQADSEQHIDDLFNDNEIGYADIGDLEAEFKLAEAERKYNEDQQELESFTQGVYNPITGRLQRELAELNAQYTIAIDLLDLESEPASRMFKSTQSKAEMAFVMNCMLSIFNKLEIRHQKIAEANVERERRRKRLELTVLYTNGDTGGVKSLEAEFAVAEKMQVLHEARGKDNRANKLMDTFDRATVRGLGDNQTYVDDMLVRIRELKELVLKDSTKIDESVHDPDGPRDSLSLAQKALEFVLADSQKLLTISNVADKMLNDADYGVSVAEARVSNAEVSTYDKLASEKEREDQKIVEDTNLRMASIAKGPEEASALIKEVVDRVGDDPMHKDRMKTALEAAKRRNAEKEV